MQLIKVETIHGTLGLIQCKFPPTDDATNQYPSKMYSGQLILMRSGDAN